MYILENIFQFYHNISNSAKNTAFFVELVWRIDFQKKYFDKPSNIDVRKIMIFITFSSKSHKSKVECDIPGIFLWFNGKWDLKRMKQGKKALSFEWESRKMKCTDKTDWLESDDYYTRKIELEKIIWMKDHL